MLERFKLSIVKIEGLGDIHKSECCINIEDKFNLICNLDTLPKSFNITCNGKISLSIKDTLTSVTIASLSFHTSLLQFDWFYWLPLFLSSENFITELPEKINLPRLLVGVSQEITLNTLNEFSEHSDTYEEESNIEENFEISNKDYLKSTYKPQHMQETLITQFSNEATEKLIEEYKKTIQDLENNIKNERKNHEKQIQEMEIIMEKLKDEIEYEKKYRLDMQQKFEQCMSLYETIKRREEKFIRSIESKYQIKQLEIVSCENFHCFPEKEIFLDKTNSFLLEKTIVCTNKLEKKVTDILSRLKLLGIMKRTKDLNYIIGAKTVTLCLKKGEVCCKNGLSLESYIFKNCKTDIEDFLRQRACPTTIKRSPNRTPLNTSRTPGLMTQRIHRY